MNETEERLNDVIREFRDLFMELSDKVRQLEVAELKRQGKSLFDEL